MSENEDSTKHQEPVQGDFASWALKSLGRVRKFAIVVFGIVLLLLTIKVVMFGFMSGQNRAFRAALTIPVLMGETATILWLLQPPFVQRLRYSWLAPIAFYFFYNVQDNLLHYGIFMSVGITLMTIGVCVAMVFYANWSERKKSKTVEQPTDRKP